MGTRQRVFPAHVLVQRIIVWSRTFADAHCIKIPSNRESVLAAARNHENERQQILHRMKELIVLKTLNGRLMCIEPLKLVEIHEKKKYKVLQKEIQGLKFQHIRKYFSWLLPKRKYKKKKRSSTRIRTQNLKRKEKKKQNKLKSRSKNAETSEVQENQFQSTSTMQDFDNSNAIISQRQTCPKQ